MVDFQKTEHFVFCPLLHTSAYKHTQSETHTTAIKYRFSMGIEEDESFELPGLFLFVRSFAQRAMQPADILWNTQKLSTGDQMRIFFEIPWRKSKPVFLYIDWWPCMQWAWLQRPSTSVCRLFIVQPLLISLYAASSDGRGSETKKSWLVIFFSKTSYSFFVSSELCKISGCSEWYIQMGILWVSGFWMDQFGNEVDFFNKKYTRGKHVSSYYRARRYKQCKSIHDAIFAWTPINRIFLYIQVKVDRHFLYRKANFRYIKSDSPWTHNRKVSAKRLFRVFEMDWEIIFDLHKYLRPNRKFNERHSRKVAYHWKVHPFSTPQTLFYYRAVSEKIGSCFHASSGNFKVWKGLPLCISLHFPDTCIHCLWCLKLIFVLQPKSTFDSLSFVKSERIKQVD